MWWCSSSNGESGDFTSEWMDGVILQWCVGGGETKPEESQKSCEILLNLH